MFKKLFIEHCHATNESYLQHLGFTIKTSGTLFFSALALVIHGLCPFLFTTTASTNIKRLNATIISRAGTAQDTATPSLQTASRSR